MTKMFDFEPLTENDIERLHRWFQAPHVRPWFGGGQKFETMSEEYLEYIHGEVPVHAYIISQDKKPIGLLTWQRFGDFPDFQRQYEVDDENAVNCDMLIGELDAAHRGWGVSILRQFLEQIVFASGPLTTCVIDPVPDNSIAIRMYEKAGFRFVRALPEDGEGNGLYLLELTREELRHPTPTKSEFYIRPARETELETAIEIDKDACSLYAEVGLPIEFDDDHPFAQQERARWTEALHKKRLLMACSNDGQPIGFIAFDIVDGRPFVEQISVRRAWMNRGIGRALIERAQRWSVREGELWLTTYDNVPWNKPWYERLGFVVVNDSDCGPELMAIFASERAALPTKEPRVAMVFRHERKRR